MKLNIAVHLLCFLYVGLVKGGLASANEDDLHSVRLLRGGEEHQIADEAKIEDEPIRLLLDLPDMPNFPVDLPDLPGDFPDIPGFPGGSDDGGLPDIPGLPGGSDEDNNFPDIPGLPIGPDDGGQLGDLGDLEECLQGCRFDLSSIRACRACITAFQCEQTNIIPGVNYCSDGCTIISAVPAKGGLDLPGQAELCQVGCVVKSCEGSKNSKNENHNLIAELIDDFPQLTWDSSYFQSEYVSICKDDASCIVIPNSDQKYVDEVPIQKGEKKRYKVCSIVAKDEPKICEEAEVLLKSG